ncbi:NAD(P)-binding protein [Ramicandelaber brevisporus]|nr:NAD(P)-binding protein [Ramicandelaber brevisporus]
MTDVKPVPDWVKHAPRLDNKLAIVTGASAGIGFHAAKFLAERGAVVVLACRNESKTTDAIDQILAECPSIKREQLVYMNIDMADFTSIRSFVKSLLDSDLYKTRAAAGEEGLDLLVNNAGSNLQPSITVDGVDTMTAINYYGPFLLTHLLLPTLTKCTTGARIVNVASLVHFRAKTFNLADMHAHFTYGETKAFMVSYTRELAKQLASNQTTSHVTAFSLHPGFIATDILNESRWYVRLAARLIGITAEDGARTTFYLATEPGIEKDSGLYFSSCYQSTIRGAAADATNDEPLWAATTELLKDHLQL